MGEPQVHKFPDLACFEPVSNLPSQPLCAFAALVEDPRFHQGVLA